MQFSFLRCQQQDEACGRWGPEMPQLSVVISVLRVFTCCFLLASAKDLGWSCLGPSFFVIKRNRTYQVPRQPKEYAKWYPIKSWAESWLLTCSCVKGRGVRAADYIWQLKPFQSDWGSEGNWLALMGADRDCAIPACCPMPRPQKAWLIECDETVTRQGEQCRDRLDGGRELGWPVEGDGGK